MESEEGLRAGQKKTARTEVKWGYIGRQGEHSGQILPTGLTSAKNQTRQSYNPTVSFPGHVLGAVVGLCGRAAASVRVRLWLSEPAAAAGAGHYPEPLHQATSQRKGKESMNKHPVALCHVDKPAHHLTCVNSPSLL